MILFYKDWYRYPNAIIHKTTKNKSWLRLAALYKRMGIRNHAFLLALHNPLLQNIDPYSENLTHEEIAMIIDECVENPWYFFREVARVPVSGSPEPIPFKANRANIALYWLYFNHITTYLIQPRQTGKTVAMQELFSYLINVATMRYRASILTKDDKLRDATSVGIRDMINALPEYMIMLSKSDVKNSEKITIKELDNMLTLHVSSKDPKQADNVGRGMTVPTVDIDEFAYIPNINIALPVMLAATTAARENAAKSGVPYGTIFTTTPGKLNTKEGRYAYDVYQGSVRWSETFLDVEDIDELKTIISKNSRQTSSGKKFDVVLLEFNHRQLGYTDEWLIERKKAALSEGIDFESDFLNKWVGGNFKTPIKKELLEVIDKSIMKNPRIKTYNGGYILRWYVDDVYINELNRSGFIVAGLDTSDAVGKDDTGLVLRDSRNGKVIAAGNYNETNLTSLSVFLTELLLTYTNMVLVPERRSSGAAIIDNITTLLVNENINPFRRIFNTVYHNKEQFIDKYPEVFKHRSPSESIINKLRKYIGFSTSGSGIMSRSSLYGNIFTSSVEYTSNMVHDELLAIELSSLTVKNGRIDHDEDGHDDMVIAWLLGYWFLLRANNKDLYSIKYTDNILKDVVNNEYMLKTDKDKSYIQEQEAIKNKIKMLIDMIQNEKNDVRLIKLYSQIRRLESKLDKSIITGYNLDTILKDMKLIKRIKRLAKI